MARDASKGILRTDILEVSPESCELIKDLSNYSKPHVFLWTFEDVVRGFCKRGGASSYAVTLDPVTRKTTLCSASLLKSAYYINTDSRLGCFWVLHRYHTHVSGPNSRVILIGLLWQRGGRECTERGSSSRWRPPMIVLDMIGRWGPRFSPSTSSKQFKSTSHARDSKWASFIRQ